MYYKIYFRDSITLLPKTPGIKRKRTVLASQNEKSSPSKCSSTFVDEADNKKFKIDDMSTIVEVSDVSSLNDTQNTSKRKLRSRKKKSVPRAIKKSKRIVSQRANNLNKSLENHKELSSVVLDTPSPIVADVFNSEKKSLVVNESISIISPINHQVQPHVAAVIEQLKMSAQKAPNTKSVSTPNNSTAKLDDLKISLFGDKQSADDSDDDEAFSR